jgi:hypothetical protein
MAKKASEADSVMTGMSELVRSTLSGEGGAAGALNTLKEGRKVVDAQLNERLFAGFP